MAEQREIAPGSVASDARSGNGLFLPSLVVAQIANILSFSLYFIFSPGPELGQSWHVSMVILGVLSLALSATAFVIRRSPWKIIPLAARLVVVLIAGFPLGESYTIELLLLISLTNECFAYYRAAVATPFSLAAIVIVAALQTRGRVWELVSPQMAADGLVVLVFAPLACVVASYYARRFLREFRSARTTATQLNEAVIEFVETNTTLQAELIEAERTVSESERHRIADELHDQLGYSVVNIRVLAEAALRTAEIEDPGARELITDIRSQAEESIKVIRGQLRVVRTRKDPEVKLGDALTRLRKAFRHTHVQVDVSFGDSPPSVSPQIDGAIYRLVQEGIANAIRHGGADHVEIRLQRVDNAIAVVVQDNGTGAINSTPGIGSKSMRRRISELGGTLVTRNTAHGFVLEARLPIRRDNG